MYTNIIKLIVDKFFSFFALLLLFPVIFLFTVLLFFINSGSPFYYQQRIGKNAKQFTLIKFVTMSNNSDTNGNLLPDYQRITFFGKFMRFFSIDELPQLFNVLKGDMSLIGPRPLLVKYLPLYNEYQSRRHEVRPGMTGWAVVNGRNALSWEEKFNLDVWYVDHVSFTLDVKIMWMTFLKVLIPHGINSSDDVVMRPFKGNEQ